MAHANKIWKMASFAINVPEPLSFFMVAIAAAQGTYSSTNSIMQ